VGSGEATGEVVGVTGEGVSGDAGAAPEFAIRVKAKNGENKCLIMGIK